MMCVKDLARQVLRARFSHSFNKHSCPHPTYGPRKGMRRRPLPLVVMTTPNHPSQPSPPLLPEVPQIQGHPPGAACFLLLLLSHPC